jgi:GPH family glycoside/pentoside/hexuronide:cation symporter
MTRDAHGLSFGEKVGYGLGDTASNLYFQMIINFLLFFYTDVFGIPAAAAGTMLMISRFWDAANDPLMGIIADRTRTRWGKFRPYLVWISVPIAVIAVLTFTTPDLDVRGRIVYAYVTYTLLMMAYTAINIPYSALMGVLSPDSAERTAVSTYRFVLAYGGAFLVQGLTLPLVRLLGGGDQTVGFPLTMAAYGLLAAGLFYVTFATTRERVQPVRSERASLRSDLADLAGNRPWRILLVMSIASLAYAIVRSGSILYYFKYCVGDEDLAGLFMVTGTLAIIAGVACTQLLARRFGKKRLYVAVMGGCSLLTGLFYLVPPDRVVPVFALNVLTMLVMAPQAPLLWAMYADTADYSEWRTGRRATGLVFSAATFAQKFGIALGGGMAGWLLALFGFVPNAEQTPGTLAGIRLMMSFIPAAGALIATVAALFYELDDPRMDSIARDLAARRVAPRTDGS